MTTAEPLVKLWVCLLFPWMVRKSVDFIGRHINTAWSWEPLSDHTWPFLQVLIHWYSAMYQKGFHEDTNGGIYLNLPRRKGINWFDSFQYWVQQAAVFSHLSETGSSMWLECSQHFFLYLCNFEGWGEKWQCSLAGCHSANPCQRNCVMPYSVWCLDGVCNIYNTEWLSGKFNNRFAVKLKYVSTDLKCHQLTHGPCCSLWAENNFLLTILDQLAMCSFRKKVWENNFHSNFHGSDILFSHIKRKQAEFWHSSN